MAGVQTTGKNLQGITTDKLFYFFLKLRKDRCRKTVKALKKQFPNDPPQRLARRLINGQTQLSFLGGMLMHLPGVLPGVGQALKLLGVAGGASVLTRMHLYLILEIALVFEQDIDDEARVPEMLSVVAATGLVAATPLALQVLELHPLFALPASGAAASSVTQLIGENAIRLYQGKLQPTLTGPEPAPEGLPG